MRRFFMLVLAMVIALELVALAMASAQEPRTAKPRQPAPAQEPSQTPAKAEPSRREPEPQRAKPRPESSQAKPRPAQPRVAPPRVPPPGYFGPRVYLFPPVSRHRAYYYHPYFGFYFGPYYGPFYPHPGPYTGPQRFAASAVRTRVRPVETEIYVNGYYAGVADDFDGVFQRLYLPAGPHEIELCLEGHQSHREKLFLAPGQTVELTHRMLPLAPGQVSRPPSSPRAIPDDWTTPSEANRGDRPASPDGLLALRVETPGAQVFVDGELWLATDDQQTFVIHVPAGAHVIEVRKSGFQTFRTEVALSEGATVRLSAQLVAVDPPAR